MGPVLHSHSHHLRASLWHGRAHGPPGPAASPERQWRGNEFGPRNQTLPDRTASGKPHGPGRLPGVYGQFVLLASAAPQHGAVLGIDRRQVRSVRSDIQTAAAYTAQTWECSWMQSI